MSQATFFKSKSVAVCVYDPGKLALNEIVENLVKIDQTKKYIYKKPQNHYTICNNNTYINFTITNRRVTKSPQSTALRLTTIIKSRNLSRMNGESVVSTYVY